MRVGPWSPSVDKMFDTVTKFNSIFNKIGFDMLQEIAT